MNTPREWLRDEIAQRSLRRKVCGKPHPTYKLAWRGLRSAASWGWDKLTIEQRAFGAYFVVTGIEPGERRAFPEDRDGVSEAGVLPRRYRWPSK